MFQVVGRKTRVCLSKQLPLSFDYEDKEHKSSSMEEYEELMKTVVLKHFKYEERVAFYIYLVYEDTKISIHEV